MPFILEISFWKVKTYLNKTVFKSDGDQFAKLQKKSL